MNAKRVETGNWREMAKYCENVIDCRRSLQLNYLADNFIREKCLSERNMARDNCLNNDDDATKCCIKDMTDMCKRVVEAVRNLCNGNYQRVSMLQMIDVLLG